MGCFGPSAGSMLRPPQPLPARGHCLHGWGKPGHRRTFQGILSAHPLSGCETKLSGIPGICPGQIKCDVTESARTHPRCTEMRERGEPPWFGAPLKKLLTLPPGYPRRGHTLRKCFRRHVVRSRSRPMCAAQHQHQPTHAVLAKDGVHRVPARHASKLQASKITKATRISGANNHEQRDNAGG